MEIVFCVPNVLNSVATPWELSFLFLKADLHGTILSHATSLRHAYDTKKSLKTLRQSWPKSVVSGKEVECDKIVNCKSALKEAYTIVYKE